MQNISDEAKIKKSFLLRFEDEFSKAKYKKLLEIVIIGVFLFIIAGPVINIISNVFDNLPTIRSGLFNDPLTGDLQWQNMQAALLQSFFIAFCAVAIDFAIGFPMAIILSRNDFRGKRILDMLVDLPMAVPTSALGFSIMLFWAIFGINPGQLLIIFAHVAFTYPYIVRNLKIAIDSINPKLEKAALTLSASKLTVFRTINFPLLKEGLIAGIILALTRSLGETGATVICAGLVETAPLLIIGLREQLDLPSASFLSLILIAICLFMLIIIKILGRRGRAKAEFWQIHPNTEKFFSKGIFTKGIKVLCMILLGILIIIPTFYIFTQMNFQSILAQLFASDNKWAYLWTSFVNSIEVGFIVIVFDLVIGIPLAFILTREKWGKFNDILDTILDVPLSIPSAALGFAVFMFWGPAGLNIAEPGIGLIIFVHITFTFPFLVRPIMATIKNIQVGHEEASAVFGASSLTTFRKITLPAIKNGIIAGTIAAFTRSLGETGATLVVMGADRTIPVLIVDWVEQDAWASAALASVLVIIFGIILLLILRAISPEYKEVN